MKFSTYLIQIILMTLTSSLAHSQTPFEYKRVIECGPKLSYSIDLPLEYKEYRSWEYYFIHFDDQGRFAIFNDNKQYSNIIKTEYLQLFNQNAASTSANFKMEDDIWKFTLSDSEKSENFLTVDLKRGTYISKRNNGNHK